MKHHLFFLAALALASCAKTPEALVVKQYQLRDQMRNNNDEPMVRMEKERRLRGAVSMAERRERLGQYYTLLWQDSSGGADHGEVKVIFQYRQGATASQVKRMIQRFSATATKGTAEFAVIGDDYFTGGRVLAWEATLMRGERELSSRRSYLWK